MPMTLFGPISICMRTETIQLQHSPSGTRRELQVFRFGTVGARPKAYVQAALHADELPGVLVAHELCRLLARAESEGTLLGEVVIVPCANPIGLSQQLLGHHIGRFAMTDGSNFNRNFFDLIPHLDRALAEAVIAPTSPSVAAIRALMLDAATTAMASVTTEEQSLKLSLLQLAIDADVVLDLHCDSEAVMHLYTLTPLAKRTQPLGDMLGAAVCLTAEDSGDHPFDEACSRPWAYLASRIPGLSANCLAVTVELRGEQDTALTHAPKDAHALFEFLRLEGLIANATPTSNATTAASTTITAPLAAVEPVIATHAGVISFAREVGANVKAGDVVATVTDPMTGTAREVRAGTSGILFARTSRRWATPGKRLCKIAGQQIIRSGKLLSP
jgi:uncharacterized protein